MKSYVMYWIATYNISDPDTTKYISRAIACHKGNSGSVIIACLVSVGFMGVFNW